MARFPGLARSLTARASSLAPTSWLRQRIVARSVTRGFAAIKRGDIEMMLRTFYDPDVEWHGTIGGLEEQRVVHGHAEVLEGFADYFETWERLALRPEEVIDTGNELIVFVHEVARGRERGMVVETDTATVQTLRDGLIVRVRNFMDRSEALEAAGLRE
jgi:ketosteroid isomerase-like protein